MKKNYWLILGMVMTTSLFAQNSTNTLPPMPAPIVTPPADTSSNTNLAVEPAKQATPVKHNKAAAPKHAPLHEPKVTLIPGPAVVEVAHVNVRGQAGLKGEVVSHLKKGETVAVLSQMNLGKHEVGEPAQWAKISLPDSTHVWVSSLFVDEATKTVKGTKLNLRAGPGENYSVLGVIGKGESLNEIGRNGKWIQIEAPTNAYAFVAAMYLKQEASGNMATNVEPSTETEPVATVAAAAAAAAAAASGSTPTTVTEGQPIVTDPATNPTEVAGAATSNNNNTNPSEAAGTSGVDTNPPPRIVSDEGVVGLVSSLIAPTKYVLYDPVTRQEINYLFTTSTNLDIGRYYGMRIIATGEEAIAERWPNTPILTIQRIEVLETNAIKKVYYPSPRQHH